MKRSTMFAVSGLLLLVALSLVPAGCVSTSANAMALQAHTWKLVKLGTSAYAGTAEVTVAFSAGRISGSTGVNSYSGTYSTPSGNNISISPGASTLIGGSPAAMKVESDFIKALSSAASYAVDDSKLALFDSSGLSVAEFTAK